MYVLYILYDIYNAYIVYGIIYTLDALCTEERGSPCRVPANICPRISWLFTKPGVSPPPPSTPEYHSRAKPATKPKTSYKICQFLTNAGIQASIAKPNQNPQCQLIRQLCIRPGAETWNHVYVILICMFMCSYAYASVCVFCLCLCIDVMTAGWTTQSKEY